MRTYITLVALLCFISCKKESSKSIPSNSTTTTKVVKCRTTSIQVRFIGFTVDELDTIIVKNYKQDNTFATSPYLQQVNGLAMDTLYGYQTTVKNVLNSVLNGNNYYDLYIPATSGYYRISELYEDNETETTVISSAGQSPGHYICYTKPKYGIVNNDTVLFEHTSNGYGYTHAYLQIKK